jgi:cyclopropane-fatty-acyl-phospholipid synthase
MTSLSLDRVMRPGPFRRRGSAGVLAIIAALRRCWSAGVLTVIAPDGSAHRIEGPAPGPEAVLEVRDPRAVGRVLGGGDIGFAEAYILGEAETPDLAKLLTTFSTNFDAMARLLAGSPTLRFVNAVGHALNRNSKKGSRRNIVAHYDLGDDFYRLWLDESLNYSSGLYTAPGQDLAAAQREKHAALARAMDLQRGQSVLEIGCGWGAFARFAASEYDARVVAVTVSPAQRAYAARMVQEAGLSEKVDIRLCDYRDVEGAFDRIASIEMFEAVGEAYWPAYFDQVRARLKPDGRAGLQIITIDDALFDDYRRRPDFIQMHIFPGGMLPSERRLKAETDRAGLAWTGVRRFGQDYAETLAEWARRYRSQAQGVKSLGFDERFDRLWRYYLSYCEAGFRTGRTDVIQLALAPA